MFVTVRGVAVLTPAVVPCFRCFGLTCYVVATWESPPVLEPETLQVEDIVLAETRRISLGNLRQGFHDGPDVKAVDPRWAEYDARVRTALLDGIATKPPEIPSVGADQAPPLARGEGELLCVAEPDLTQFMGADRVHASLSQRNSDDRREVLIEVELHARRPTASCIVRPSA